MVKIEKAYKRYLAGMRLIAKFRPIWLAYFVGYVWTRLLSPRTDEQQQVMEKMNTCRSHLHCDLHEAWQDYLWHASASVLNTYMYPAMSRHWVGRRVQIIGGEYLLDANGIDTGTLILTAHQHSMMMLAVTAGLMGMKMYPILMDPQLTVPEYLSEYVTRAVRDSASQYNGGNYILVDYDTAFVRPLHRVLKSGSTVLSANDFPESLAPKRRLSIPFLGRYISLPTGSVEIAMKCEARIVPAFIYESRGMLVAHFYPALTGSLDEIMHSYASLLENCVKNDPGAWEGWKWPDLFETNSSNK